MPVIDAYTQALQLGGQNDMDTARMAVDGELKAIQVVKDKPRYDYTQRAEMLRVIANDALSAKKDGIMSTLRNQVAQRHEGR